MVFTLWCALRRQSFLLSKCALHIIKVCYFKARKRKNRRLKQAKEEAQAEIEKYKAEREAQFHEHEVRYAGSKGDVAARIDADAKARISAMDASVSANKASVISNLIDTVCNIEPRVHVNYRPTA